jgi:hypothetical protein
MKPSLASLLLLALASPALAQPTDQQVLRDIKKPGVLKAELRPGTAKKVWSSANSQYYWDRAVVVWRNANLPEFPNAMLEVGGFARYAYVTNSYQEFLTTYNSYTGIPAPSSTEIMAMMQKNLRGVMGEYKYSIMVGDFEYFRYPENGGPMWDNPKHLVVPVEVAYERKEGPTWTVRYADRLRVHFYRDNVNGPWKPDIITEEVESTRGARKEYPAAELKRMPTRSELDAKRPPL